MKRKSTAGQTGVTLPIYVFDSNGAGLSGLVYNTANLVAEYRREGQSAWTAITLVAGTLGTWTAGGIVADGALGGAYEFCPPDAAFAFGAAVRWVQIRLRGAATMKPVLMEFELDAVNYRDATGFGLANLDATIGSRLPTASYTTPPSVVAIRTDLDANSTMLGAIADKTDLLPSAWPTYLNVLAIDASGRVVLQPTGLDAIVIETGINLRQAQSPILAAASGKIAGANPGGGTVTVKGGGDANNTTRITAETDQYGNRTSAVLNLPS